MTVKQMGAGGRSMEYRYYGQHGEDYLLWHFFDFKRTGSFLDIGAHDGVSLSNTKSFEEQGWTGICVEPSPSVYALCRQVRRCVVHAACVGGPDRHVVLRVDCSGLFAGINIDEAHVERSYQMRDGGDPQLYSVEVPAIRAAELIQPDDPPIDFASVDIEGTEIDALRGLELGRNQPRVLVVEALTDTAREALDNYLGGFGYMLGRSVVCNHFYVRKLRDVRKLQSITIQCKLTMPHIEGYGPADIGTHAWSAPTTRSTIRFVLGKLRQRYRRWVWKV
jgi:FkbM family methyltransferase